MKPEGNAMAGASSMPARHKRRHKRHDLLSLIRHHKKSVDMPAGTIAADQEAAPTSVRTVSYDAAALHEHDGVAPSQLATLRNASDVLWIDVTGLRDTRTIEEVGAAFGIHKLTLEDITNTHQRPKVETFDHYVFIVMKMLDHSDAGLTEQMAIIVGDDYLITFQERPGDCFDATRARLKRVGGQLRSEGPDRLAHALIDAVIDNFFPLLENYGELIENLEDLVVSQPEPSHVERLHAIKRDLLEIRRAVWPTRELVNALIRDEHHLFCDSTRIYLRDCYDHAIQLMDIVETYREIASGLLDVYLSSMSARMNEIMKVLTIIATIFIPLSFFAGIWGMNFENMPELKEPWAYPAALAFMATIAGGLLVYFRRKGWLGERAPRKAE
ncbi:magnesium/cobalt transporter CorA [Emcibacter sp. SYSU 3D8]|uniref:magnesium/cobalt transporter CorA n=1 Tax=Emcibacter sp. SYSU 3D8 TaxID=3133969 RepID=UPI0031FEC75D